MLGFTTYINFNGNTREVLNFYKEVFSAETNIMNFDQNQCEGLQMAPDAVLHGELTKNGTPLLMASDMPSNMTYSAGTNYSITIGCESDAEIEDLFAKLSDGGKVNTPLADMFWGARYGAVTDKFGVAWLLNFQKAPPPAA